MLDNRVVTLMQRLIDDGAASTPKNATSMRLHDDFRLGRLKGKSLLLTERDRAAVAFEPRPTGRPPRLGSAQVAAAVS